MWNPRGVQHEMNVMIFYQLCGTLGGFHTGYHIRLNQEKNFSAHKSSFLFTKVTCISFIRYMRILKVFLCKKVLEL